MSFESIAKIYEDYENGKTLRPMGDGAVFHFGLTPKEDEHYRLFVMGETELFYFWKNEPNHPLHYHQLTDSLDTLHAEKAQYALNMSSKRN